MSGKKKSDVGEKYCENCGDTSFWKDTKVRADGHTTHYIPAMRRSHEADGSKDHYTISKDGHKKNDVHIIVGDEQDRSARGIGK